MHTGMAFVREAIRKRRFYPGEPMDLALPRAPDPDLELQKLTRVRGEVSEIAAACRAVIEDLNQRIMANLGGGGGAARVGMDFYDVDTAEKFSIKEEQRPRFWRWVHAHQIADRLFNPNAARKGRDDSAGLRHMASLPDPETGELYPWAKFRDIFFDTASLDRLELGVQPVDGKDTPKWIQKLPDGWVRRPAAFPTEDPREKGDNNNDDGGGTTPG